MAILSKGKTFTSTEQVTSTKLHELVDNATFATGAVDDATVELVGGQVALKDAGVTTAKLATDAVTPAKVDEDNATEFTMLKIGGTQTRNVPYNSAPESGALTIDLDNGNFQVIPINGNVTSVAALANMASGKQFTFVIKNAGTNTMSSWDSTWKWYGGTTPELTATADSVDIISGCTDGTNAYVTMLKNFA